MICFSEQQKQEIIHTGILVIEFKRSIIKACEALKNVFHQIVNRISKILQVIHREYKDLPSKEKIKVARRLSKCGYSEKEINLMVGVAHHCRNNC